MLARTSGVSYHATCSTVDSRLLSTKEKNMRTPGLLEAKLDSDGFKLSEAFRIDLKAIATDAYVTKLHVRAVKARNARRQVLAQFAQVAIRASPPAVPFLVVPVH